MDKDNVVRFEKQASVVTEGRLNMEAILRQGAQRMLQQAIENEVEEFLASQATALIGGDRRAVVRNGSLPARNILTGMGSLEVQQPRVRDRREGEKVSFTSGILPRYMRRAPSIDALIPALYLRGISTGDFTEALSAILGANAVGLSPANIVRLKEGWEGDYEKWGKRDLSTKRYVYWWADGVYFNVRLEDERRCILVLMGALADGTKELIAVVDGERESKLSWLDLLSGLKAQGLADGPALAVGDGGLGFWAAMGEAFPKSREQRCWVHKTANVLDKLPKTLQPAAKEKIHQMYQAPTKESALKELKAFVDLFKDKYPKACECLKKDEDVLFNFYDLPAAHWQHLRTTNPIESTFATVRLRTQRTKGCGSRKATLTMVWQLIRAASTRWRRLKGAELISKVIEGIIFVDGEEKKAVA